MPGNQIIILKLGKYRLYIFSFLVQAMAHSNQILVNERKESPNEII